MASSNVTTVRQGFKKHLIEVKWILSEFEKCFFQTNWFDDLTNDFPGRLEGRTIKMKSGDQVKPYLIHDAPMVKIRVDYLNKVEDSRRRICTFKAKVVKSDEMVVSVEGKVGHGEYELFTPCLLPCSDDGSLTILLRIDLLTYTNMDEYEGPETKDLLRFAHAAAKNGELSDFQLISGSAVFKCHRIYLAQSSDVFRKLFQYEPQKTEADLSAHSASDVEKLLEFVYTNNLADEESFNSTSLLRLSDEYDVVGLRVRCEKSLADKLTPENAEEMKSLAQEVYAPFLLKKAEAFLNLN